MKPLAYQSIRALQQQFAKSELRPCDLVDDCVKWHDARHHMLHAYHQFDVDLFKRAAKADVTISQAVSLAKTASIPDSKTTNKSNLAGIPFSVKSVIAADGYPCYAGTAKPLPSDFVQQGSFVGSLKTSGAVVSGITHAAEFAVGGLGVNEHWPTPRNPWDSVNHRVPGGSSSGAAVSVWEGSCVFAIGTDTGGSIRVPASAAGLAGLKTTSGRWAVDGVVPLAQRFDSIGLIAHRVEDLAAVFDNIDGSQSSLSGLSFNDFEVRRAGQVCWESLDSGIAEVLEATIEELCRAGMPLQKSASAIQQKATSLRSDNKPNSAAIECLQMLNSDLKSHRASLGLHVREFIRSEEHRPMAEYHARVKEVEDFQVQVKALQKANEITLSPTLCYTPPTMESIAVRENYLRYSDGLLHNTVLVSMCRQCALTLPVGLDACGMPVGLQIIAPQGSDELLLQFGRLVERVLGSGLDRLGLPPLMRETYL